VEDLAPQVRLLNQEVARLGGVDGQRKKGVTNEIMGRVKVVASKQIVTVQMKTPSPRWCPAGCSKTQRRRLQKMRQKKMRREMEQDQWFSGARPMVKVKQTWSEKCLEREQDSDIYGSNKDEINEEISSGSGEEVTEKQGMDVGVNMMFVIPTEFRAP
jgi:hypothetical protein